MTKSPKEIIFPLEEGMTKDDLIRKFLLAGYGSKKARAHIRAFEDAGLIFVASNGDICAPYADGTRCRL